VDARAISPAERSPQAKLPPMKPPIAVALLACVACAHRPWEDPGPRWQRITSEHFVVDTDSDADTSGPLIDRLEDVHAALSQTFFQGLAVRRVRVLLFDRKRDYQTIRPSTIAAGFFQSFPDGGVLVFSAQEESFDEVASIATHELAHRFLRALAPGVPAWLNEGFAQYVEAIEVKDDLVVFDASSALSRATHAPLLPLSQVLAATNVHYHGDANGGYYLTSRRLVRWLFGDPAPGTVARFRTLVARAAAASSIEDQEAAVSAALGGLPFPEVEQQIRSDYRRTQWGVAQRASRHTLAVTLTRAQRPAPRMTTVDSAEVRALCRAIKHLAPPPAPLP
jgi:hypothetical protein